MQIAWSVSKHRGGAGSIADGASELLQDRSQFRVRPQVREEAEVVALTKQRQQRVGALAVQGVARRVAQRQRDLSGQDAIRRRHRQLMRRHVTLQNGARGVLRLLHVRLVERVDPQDRAGDRGRDFPAHEFGPERRRLREVDFDDRGARLPQRADLRVAHLLVE